MKIAVISDTHRLSKYINLSKELISDCDVLIHLGDNTDDIAELTSDFYGEVYAVKGNCDYENKYPKEQLLTFMGKKIFITHGDLYGVKYGMTNIYYKGKEVGADIVLFGHSHIHQITEYDNIIFMNPGSISLPRSNGRYVGIIELSQGNKPDVYLESIL